MASNTQDDTKPTFSTVSKVCTKCSGIDFGKSGKCKTCDRLRQAAWKAANPEKVKSGGVAYRIANAEKIKAAKAAYHAANKERINAELARKRLFDPEHARELQRASYSRNKEKANQRSAAYYQKNSAQIAKINHAWRQKNIDLVKKMVAAWAAANPSKVRASKDAWQARNPDYRRLQSHTRRARKQLVGGRLSNGLRQKLFLLQRGKCPCCGKPLGNNYHLDHIHPISRGGSNTDDNMQLLRARCNIQKHSKHPVEFMQSRGFLL